ncbi:hypothetical protein NC652_013277 [Populus alba x Populus x berolinensis]|nr:hypothetical protein NC652_013277 [Populus alba x Populus x berolinensis]
MHIFLCPIKLFNGDKIVLGEQFLSIIIEAALFRLLSTLGAMNFEILRARNWKTTCNDKYMRGETWQETIVEGKYEVSYTEYPSPTDRPHRDRRQIEKTIHRLLPSHMQNGNNGGIKTYLEGIKQMRKRAFLHSLHDLYELVLLTLFTTLFQVSLLSPLSVSKQTDHEETRGINPMDLPISLGWLVQDNPMKHCHVVVQPNCVAHQGLTQAQKL